LSASEKAWGITAGISDGAAVEAERPGYLLSIGHRLRSRYEGGPGNGVSRKVGLLEGRLRSQCHGSFETTVCSEEQVGAGAHRLSEERWSEDRTVTNEPRIERIQRMKSVESVQSVAYLFSYDGSPRSASGAWVHIQRHPAADTSSHAQFSCKRE